MHASSPAFCGKLPASANCLPVKVKLQAAVQVMASLRQTPHDLASALTLRGTHDASAAHQVQQGKQTDSTASSATAKGCGPYHEQAEGAATLIKADWSGQVADQRGDAAAEAMPLLCATSETGSMGRDSLDSLRRSSTSSGSSRSSLELAVFKNAPLGPTLSGAGSAGWLGSLGVDGLRSVSLVQCGAHPHGSSGQQLQFPSAAALLSGTAADHRHHGSEASPGDGSTAGGTGMSSDAAAGHHTSAVRSSGPGSSLLQVSCLCAAGPSA